MDKGRTLEKGARSERRTMILLRREGFNVLRSPRSPFDVIGFNSVSVVLVQVKTNYWPPAREVVQMRNFPAPPNAIKLIHRWRDGASSPDVRFV